MKLYCSHLWRYIHVAVACYNLVYVYSPLHEWQYGFASVRMVSMPLLIISGIMLVRAKKNRKASVVA